MDVGLQDRTTLILCLLCVCACLFSCVWHSSKSQQWYQSPVQCQHKHPEEFLVEVANNSKFAQKSKLSKSGFDNTERKSSSRRIQRRKPHKKRSSGVFSRPRQSFAPANFPATGFSSEPVKKTLPHQRHVTATSAPAHCHLTATSAPAQRHVSASSLPRHQSTVDR